MTRPPAPWQLLAALILGVVMLAASGVVSSRALADLDPGSTAVVRADGDCLRLRGQPSLQGTLLTCIPDGSLVSVLAGVVSVDGYRWQQISYRGRTGWSVNIYLQAAPGAAPPGAVPTQAPPVSSTPLPTPTINGFVPSGDGIALVVWAGGPIDRIPPIVAQRGCTLRALWVTQNGVFLGYIYGAPTIVNLGWNAVYPDGSLPPNSAVILVCAAGTASPPPASTPVTTPAVPVATPGVPPGTPNLPPGPAGNN
jgi:hypothetical protein